MNTVITAVSESASQGLASLQTVKDMLGVTDNATDYVIEQYIAQASAEIARSCNRIFGAATVTQTFLLQDKVQSLVLSRFPLTSVTSVTEDGTALTVSTDYVLQSKPDGRLLRMADGVQTNWNACKIDVVYVAGYTLPTAPPADLQAACLNLVKLKIAQGSRDPLAKRIEIPGVRTVDYWVGSTSSSDSGFPPEVERLIAPFRDLPV